MGEGFEWDPAKAKSNWWKHGVSFEEAEVVFDDPLALIEHDVTHSADEERWAITGMTRDWRLLVVWYTEREGAIRIIGCRRATKAEERRYVHRTDR